MPIQFSNTTTHSPVFDNLAFLEHPSPSTFRILSTAPFCLAVPPWPEAGESKGVTSAHKQLQLFSIQRTGCDTQETALLWQAEGRSLELFSHGYLTGGKTRKLCSPPCVYLDLKATLAATSKEEKSKHWSNARCLCRLHRPASSQLAQLLYRNLGREIYPCSCV